MDYNQIKNKMKGEAIAEQEDKFYEMTRKGQLAGTGKENPFGTVSSAPSQTITGAKQALGESGTTFTGSGGYEYGANADGSFMILKSGRGATPGTVVKPGMKGYDAIKKEFEAVKSGKSVSSKPRSMSPSRKSGDLTPEQGAAEAKRVSADGPGLDITAPGESMRDAPRGGESTTRSQAEMKSSQVYSNAALLARAENALVREGTDPVAASKIVRGLKAPPAAALLAASGPATPSMAPCPNSSGCLVSFFSSA